MKTGAIIMSDTVAPGPLFVTHILKDITMHMAKRNRKKAP